MAFFIYEKVNNSIATKLRLALLKNRREIEIFFVHDTIQGLNCVVHCLNVKIN